MHTSRLRTGMPMCADCTDETRFAEAQSFGNHSIRSRDWRLIVYENGAKELYDHRNDPDEFRNLANAPAYKKIRNELSRWLPQNAASEFKSKSELSRGRR